MQCFPCEFGFFNNSLLITNSINNILYMNICYIICWSFARKVSQILFDKNDIGKRADCQELASHWDLK